VKKMHYLSTRDASVSVSGSEAIVKGLSDEGGLFVPVEFPHISKADFEVFAELDYPQRAAFILERFLPELKDGLAEFCEKAYARFDGDPAPLVRIDEGQYLLELWHGPTHAFKDIALTLLPHLLQSSKEKTGARAHTLILTATSGDTGKAALEGFADAQGVSVVVFYPQDGVSQLQKLQMQTAKGRNVKAIALSGNFDDAQTAVKEIFTDTAAVEALEKHGIVLSSANSINFGRLVPQIVYYFSAYADLVNGGQLVYGQPVNFCVPTGNFGNILAGYYAVRMGLPVNKLICASNRNNVLTDFFAGGAYTVQNREFYKTASPSMDILISSNLERLIFELSGRDAQLTALRMRQLKEEGAYKVTGAEHDAMRALFSAGWASEEAVSETIAEIFDEYGYISDPHTAVALRVYADYKAKTADKTPCVTVSTASPYKFTSDVLKALGETPLANEQKNLSLLEDLTALPIPESIGELFGLKKIHTDTVEKSFAKQAVLDYGGKLKKGVQ